MNSTILPGINTKEIIIVLHGQKEDGPDPGLTGKGLSEMRVLSRHLPPTTAKVIAGTGRRHHDVATGLGLTISSYNPLVGRPESLERDGTVVLPYGLKVPKNMIDTTGLGEASVAFLNSLQAGTVLCSGRPFLIYLFERLGVKARINSAEMYRLEGDTLTRIAAAAEEM